MNTGTIKIRISIKYKTIPTATVRLWIQVEGLCGSNPPKYEQKRPSLNIEARLEGITTAADTHLNTCAVLSQMNRHASALQVTNLLPSFSVLVIYFPLDIDQTNIKELLVVNKKRQIN